MDRDPFEALGLEAKFDLGPAEVERAYLRRVHLAHPDSGEAESAPGGAAVLNWARGVLQDPLQRAEALLARLGGPTKEQDRTLPGGFLDAMMATRLEVEEALASGDPRARATWSEWAGARREESSASVLRLFAAGPPPPLRDIRRELNAWRYIERLIEQLDPLYDPTRAERP